MSDLAIRVEHLGKAYQLGEADPHGGLKAALTGLLKRRHTSTDSARKIWALRGVSFEIEAGEVIGIIGRNGAGKTTLLKLLTRIAEPDEGRAEIEGRVGSLLEIGTGFHPELTGRENTFLNGSILGMSRREIRQKLEAILEFAEIGDFIDTPVKRYSTGMYMRLAFSVAAHLKPDILIVDEALAVGDIAFQRKCLRKMRDAAQDGRTVLFVSHDMTPISELTTRCLLLDGGRIIFDGEPSVAISKYLASGGGLDYAADLADKARPPGLTVDRPLSFTRISIDAATEGLTCGRPLLIAITCQIARDLPRIGVRVSILHPNGTKLLSCRSDEQGNAFDFTAGQTVTIRLQLESVRLNHGTYRIALSAVDGEEHMYDAIADALQFEVLPEAGQGDGSAEAGLGLRLPALWSLEQSS